MRKPLRILPLKAVPHLTAQFGCLQSGNPMFVADLQPDRRYLNNDPPARNTQLTDGFTLRSSPFTAPADDMSFPGKKSIRSHQT